MHLQGEGQIAGSTFHFGISVSWLRTFLQSRQIAGGLLFVYFDLTIICLQDFRFKITRKKSFRYWWMIYHYWIVWAAVLFRKQMNVLQYSVWMTSEGRSAIVTKESGVIYCLKWFTLRKIRIINHLFALVNH